MKIGEAYHKGDLNYVTHKIAHAALGGAIAAGTGGDVASGVIGGAVGEITGEFLSKEIEDALRAGDIDPTKVHQWMDAGVDVSKLAAGLVAAAAGGDVNTAADVADNAAKNNAFWIAIPILLEVADKILMAADAVEFGEAVITGDVEKQNEIMLGFLIGMGIETTVGSILPGSYVALKGAIKAGKLDVIIDLLPDKAVKWIIEHSDDAIGELRSTLHSKFPDLKADLDNFNFDGLKNSDELNKILAKKKGDTDIPNSGGSSSGGSSSGGSHGNSSGGKPDGSTSGAVDIATQVHAEHLEEMKSLGVKYTHEDVLFTHKMPDGKIAFLEKGSSNGGLAHILEEHKQDFWRKGISKDEIPDFLQQALEKNNVVGYQGQGSGRPIYELVYKGKRQRVAITVGNNGFVVGANPKGLK